MQNRYTGDIGDFGKLGLLRQLSVQLSIGMNWYLVPDESHNRDGEHIDYLSKSSFQECDPPLFDTLTHIVSSGKREVASLENSAVLPDDKVVYYSEVLDFSRTTKPERKAKRADWHQKALAKLKGRDLIFVDPDNGLIVPSAEDGTKSNKYVLPSELADYYKQGSSVVYYQHKARIPDEDYIKQHHRLISSGTFPGASGAGLKFVSTSQRFYFFLLRPEHIIPVNACIEQMLSSHWNRCFQLLEGLGQPSDPESGKTLPKKQILIIQGGGRPKGNTAQLVSAFTQGAESAGHTVETVSLLKNEVKGCLGCNACRYGKPCVQKDAFNDLIPKIKTADCIVFASPLYFWTVSARIKAFIERFYCIAQEDPSPPLGRYEKYPVKDCALLMTAADDFFWTFQQAQAYYQFALVNYIGFHDRGMLLAGGCGDTNGPPQISKTGHLKRAYTFGRELYPGVDEQNTQKN